MVGKMGFGSTILYDAGDLALSEIDNIPLFGSLGAIGVDWGDWIISIIYLYKGFWSERRKSNAIVALFLIWEMCNYPPFCFIPVFGEVLETISNLTPAATICRLLGAMPGLNWIFATHMKQAKRWVRGLEKMIAEAEGLPRDAMIATEALGRAKQLIEDEDGIGAKRIAKSTTKKLEAAIRRHVEDIQAFDAKELSEIYEEDPEGSPEEMAPIQEGISVAEESLEKSKKKGEERAYSVAIREAEKAKAALEVVKKIVGNAEERSDET